MEKKKNVSLDRVIAKIDNDFNPDNSDWIPRVGAWAIDALSQIDALRTNKKKKKYNIVDRIVYLDCPLTKGDFKVYDKNGCEIKEASNVDCRCITSMGESASETSSVINEFTPDTIDIINTGNQEDTVFAETINDKYPYRYNIIHNKTRINPCERNYVIADCNKLEVNFDDEYLYIEMEYIETVCSETYGCELPVIPNNGIVLEAITYYCMYKMLTRGYKHSVFNLNASQYGTNPYYLWKELKEEAKRSIINDNIDETSKLFRSNLFIETFDPRN